VVGAVQQGCRTHCCGRTRTRLGIKANTFDNATEAEMSSLLWKPTNTEASRDHHGPLLTNAEQLQLGAGQVADRAPGWPRGLHVTCERHAGAVARTERHGSCAEAQAVELGPRREHGARGGWKACAAAECTRLGGWGTTEAYSLECELDGARSLAYAGAAAR